MYIFIESQIDDAPRRFRGRTVLLQVYEEIVANMTKPLGITIEASTDQAALIYVTSVGQQVWVYENSFPLRRVGH